MLSTHDTHEWICVTAQLCCRWTFKACSLCLTTPSTAPHIDDIYLTLVNEWEAGESQKQGQGSILWKQLFNDIRPFWSQGGCLIGICVSSVWSMTTFREVWDSEDEWNAQPAPKLNSYCWPPPSNFSPKLTTDLTWSIRNSFLCLVKWNH